jgi:Leucine-rich repeat (LRR) protein
VAVVSVWLAIQVNRVRQQRDAVRAIRQLSGLVEYDSEPHRPEWLRHIVGDDSFQVVVHIDLSGEDFADEDLRHLRQFRNLRRLSLADTKVGDAGLEHIAELRELEMLYLRGCDRITNDGLRHLQGLTNLRDLTITSDQVTNDGIQHLAGLKNLESLDLSEVSITDEGVKHLHGLTRLKLLFFCRLGEVPPLVSVEAVQQLKQLIPACSIVHVPPGDRPAARAAAEAQTRQAELDREQRWKDIRKGASQKVVVRNAEEALAAIRALPAAVEEENGAVVFVDLDNYGVNDDFVAHLRFLTGLKILDLSRNPITSDGVENLAGLTNLERLHVDSTKIDDAAMQTIGRLKKLKTLWLLETDVTDQGLKHLASLNELEQLYLADNRITDEGTKSLAGLANLRTLLLVRCEVTNDGLEHLRGLSKLELLDVSGTKVTESAAKQFASALPKCKVELYRNAKRR